MLYPLSPTKPTISPILWPTLWTVTEGMAGTENQCVGIAEALGISPVIKRIGLNEPWKTLSPYLGLESAGSFTGDMLQAPWPNILIASGRKSIAASHYIKKMSKGRTFTVQVQDPRWNRADFDLIIAPEHDRIKGKNIFVTTAAPNRINESKLSEARVRFSPLFEKLPVPRVAVLIGGDTNMHKLTADKMIETVAQLRNLADTGHGLMVTASRRTGDANTAILKSALKGTTAYIWDGPGPSASENPYFGLLAWADAIIVTSDSMSMISEAATTGKPVYVIDIGQGKDRHKQMMNNLINNGIIRPFAGEIALWSYKPLQDAYNAAQEIKRKSGLFSN